MRNNANNRKIRKMEALLMGAQLNAGTDPKRSLGYMRQAIGLCEAMGYSEAQLRPIRKELQFMTDMVRIREAYVASGGSGDDSVQAVFDWAKAQAN